MVRRSRAATAADETPLGSLTQVPVGSLGSCRTCHSSRVTRIVMNLTDGTPVEFTSCHRCEERTWESGGEPLPVDEVLSRTRKLR